MRINEIFTSIDGEVNYYGQGIISTFIRFQGCNLECHYCDTKQARDPEGGKEMDVGEIIDQIQTPKVTITGGEPLCQLRGLVDLVRDLYGTGIRHITIETNGTKQPWVNDYGAHWIVDCKLDQPFNRAVYAQLGPEDYIKIIMDSPLDFPTVLERYQWFKQSGCQARIAVSPIHGEVDPRALLDKLIDKGIYDIQINVQLHKLIGAK